MKYLILLLLFSCAHSFHQEGSDFSLNPRAKNGTPIRGIGSQTAILGIVTNTDYVDEAVRDLESKCSGVISPISTQYYTDLGFLHWTNHVVLDGVCLK